jgi:hypothetical protein
MLLQNKDLSSMFKPLSFSNTLAVCLGILLPLMETFRRRTQLLQLNNLIYWFDDYILGAILLFAAWKAKRNPMEGQKYLSAAWGVTTGALFLSTLSQVERLGGTDPSMMSPLTVAVVKAVLLIVALSGLVTSLYKIR